MSETASEHMYFKSFEFDSHELGYLENTKLLQT